MNQNSKKSAFLNYVTESEPVRGRNGVAIYNEWHKREEPDNCSRGDLARAYRLGKGY